jgi:hypothetical protein
MLRYHENQLHLVTHSYLASILSVRHFAVNAENVLHLVSVTRRIGSNIHLLPLHSQYEFHAEQFIVLASRFNVQRFLCVIAVNRHKYRLVRGGGNFSHLHEWL